LKPGPPGPFDEVGLEDVPSCRPAHRAPGVITYLAPQTTDQSSTTYGVVAAEVDKFPDTRGAVMYLEEVGYTPHTWVADTRTNQVPSDGTSKAEDARR
jgi:hypothetical protein